MKFAGIATACLAAFACAAACASVRDGTYVEHVKGHNAFFDVSVTIRDGKISKVETIKSLESPNVGSAAIELLSNRIVEKQSYNVDAITGATLTSSALKRGVRKAVQQAGAKDEFSRRIREVSALPANISGEVVIVGGGGAGLAAAVSAVQQGSKVTIVEKMGFLGGSTNVCGGAFNAPGTKFQTSLGIKDTPANHFENTMRGGHYTNDPELVRYMVTHAKDALHWFEEMGLVVNPKVGAATGALYQRSHYPAIAGGHTYVRTLLAELAKYPHLVTVLLNTQATDLVQKDGRIVGVVANNLGKKVEISASKGVILATGGFGANIEYRQKVNTGIWKEAKLDKQIGCSNIRVAAQGEGLIMAEKVNAELIGLADIQVHPNGTPGTGLMLDIKTSGRNRLFINSNGDRFVNEGAARDVLSKAVFAQPGQGYWLVQNHLRYPDENAIDPLSGRTMRDMLAQGRVKRAENLEDLAKIMNVDVKRLKATIEEYNKVARHEVEKDRFGFKANHTDDRPMTEGPWYVAKKVPTIHHTMGGIKINTNTEVIGKDGRIIPGLFAAGEVTGGIHGENRVGGNAITDCMVFGRTAGKMAAGN